MCDDYSRRGIAAKRVVAIHGERLYILVYYDFHELINTMLRNADCSYLVKTLQIFCVDESVFMRLR